MQLAYVSKYSVGSNWVDLLEDCCLKSPAHQKKRLLPENLQGEL